MNTESNLLTSWRALWETKYFPFLIIILVRDFLSCVLLRTWQNTIPLLSLSKRILFLDNCSWIRITYNIISPLLNSSMMKHPYAKYAYHRKYINTDSAFSRTDHIIFYFFQRHNSRGTFFRKFLIESIQPIMMYSRRLLSQFLEWWNNRQDRKDILSILPTLHLIYHKDCSWSFSTW